MIFTYFEFTCPLIVKTVMAFVTLKVIVILLYYIIYVVIYYCKLLLWLYSYNFLLFPNKIWSIIFISSWSSPRSIVMYFTVSCTSFCFCSLFFHHIFLSFLTQINLAILSLSIPLLSFSNSNSYFPKFWKKKQLISIE